MEVLKALDKRYRKVWRENRYHSFRRRRKWKSSKKRG
jgi:predicted DCC family thiol-disulfide oxidoreductase YuxK